MHLHVRRSNFTSTQRHVTRMTSVAADLSIHVPFALKPGSHPLQTITLISAGATSSSLCDAGEHNVVPYNPDILRVWGANMDIQPIGSSYACNVYVGGYMTKFETAGLESNMQKTLDALPPSC
eukprot:jgi/Botrbrau1/13597/Bobra.0307s0016.1